MSAVYFAYGSNLHPLRLRERVPSAEVMGPASLPGHGLHFDKRGRDGSGKCDVRPTTARGECVLGVLYRVAGSDLVRLDRHEDAGRSYERRLVRVRAFDADVDAITYLAASAWIDPALIPWDWYKALVVAGARHHGFAPSYVDRIVSVPSRPDPDAERSAEHAALLARIAASG